jgi:hypothetical protein
MRRFIRKYLERRDATISLRKHWRFDGLCLVLLIQEGASNGERAHFEDCGGGRRRIGDLGICSARGSV